MKSNFRFVPSGFEPYFQDADLGIEVYVSSNIALCFGGRRSNPDIYCRYRSIESRDAAINQFIEGLRQDVVRKAERKAAQKEARKNAQVKVGDIFKSSWGYDQTNVDYYQVVEVSGQSVVVQPIAQECEETSFMAGQCVPVPGSFCGEPMKKRIQVCGDSVYLSLGYRSAYLMKPIAEVAGKPVYEASYFSCYA